MSFVGIDPAGLATLGSLLEAKAETIAGAAGPAADRLGRHGRFHIADRTGTRLSATSRLLEAYAGDLGWRIDTVLNQPANPAVIHAAGTIAVMPTDLAVGLPLLGSAVGADLAVADIVALQEMAPDEVTEFMAQKTDVEIGLLVATHPELFTDLDGAPPWARFAASDLLIAERIVLLNQRLEELHDLADSKPFIWQVHQAALAAIAATNEELTELEKWQAEGRQILLFDPEGDGRVVEVFGDLDGAEHIAVVVPGITNDRSNFDGFRTGAANLHQRSEELAVGDVATIAWLGYDTPDGPGAVIKNAARAADEPLIDFVAALDAMDGKRHITVIGHSYGSLVTGMAAGAGLAADEVVFVGSPGTSLERAGDAILEPGGKVWAGLAHADPIGAGIDLSEFITPAQQFRQSMRRALDAIEGEEAIRDLHHGTNPAHDDFGAIEFLTDGSWGHSQYFKPETVTLDNLVYIIAGMDARVSVEIPDEIIMAPGPLDEPWSPLPEPGEPA